MPKNKDFALRIEIIDECLRNHLRKWTLEDLLRQLNECLEDRYGKSVSKRTLQDDIRYLINFKNAPIQKTKAGSKTYFSYSDKRFSLKNLPIEAEEIDRLNDVIHILKQVSDFSLLGEVEAIIKKLENTIHVRSSDPGPAIQFEQQPLRSGTDFVSELYDAVKNESAIRLTYKPFGALQAREHIFHPYLLKEYRNRWFILGRVGRKTQVTCFALDRIQKINNSAQPFLSNTVFDPDTWFNNAIGVTVPEEELPQEILLKIAAAQAPYVRTQPLHQSQQLLKQYKDGGLLIKLLLLNNYEMRAVLLSFGDGLEVLAPASLRTTIKETLEKALKKY
ncbi:WYL domain-containing protein [Niabella terrae]